MPQYTELDPAKYAVVDFTMTPDPVPPKHATENAVLARWQIEVPGDALLELYAERRKDDWRILLPNGKIALCNTDRDMQNFIKGIAIGRTLKRESVGT